MTLKKSYLLNTGIVGVSKVFENIFAYLIIVLITRNLGAEGLGQYSFMFSLAGLFFIFNDLGVTELMVRNLSRNFSNADKYVANTFALKAIMSSASLIIYGIVIIFISKDYKLALLVAGLIQVVNILTHLFDSVIRIQGKGLFLSLASFAERLVALIGASVVFYFSKNLLYFVSILLVSSLVRLIINYVISSGYFKFKWELDGGFLKKLILQSYPFVLVFLFAVIYIQLDTVMLSFFKGDLVVGWYQAGYKLITILNVVPNLIMLFGFPLMSKLFIKDKDSLKVFFEKVMTYSISFMLPIMIGVWFVGDRILNFIYSISDVESFIAFKILIIAQLFIFLTIIMGQMISAVNRQKDFMKIAGFGAVLNILFNFLFIPQFSLYGAGIATALTYFIMYLLMERFIRKNLLRYTLYRTLLIPILGSLLMTVVLFIIGNFHILLIVLLAGISYLLVVLPWIIKKEFMHD